MVLLDIFKAVSMNDLIGLASGLVKLANNVLDKVEESKLRADERRVIFIRDLALLQKRVATSREMNAALASLPDSAVIDELSRDDS